jgi:hypothetical protein
MLIHIETVTVIGAEDFQKVYLQSEYDQWIEDVNCLDESTPRPAPIATIYALGDKVKLDAERGTGLRSARGNSFAEMRIAARRQAAKLA